MNWMLWTVFCWMIFSMLLNMFTLLVENDENKRIIAFISVFILIILSLLVYFGGHSFPSI